MMLKRIITVFSLAVAAATASVTFAAEMSSQKPVKLAANAPEKYEVVKGDTLWGISEKFLNEPWRWPEVWRMNEGAIKNPHLIYPGDIIYLSYDSSGNPYLSLNSKGSGKSGSASARGTVHLEPKVYAEPISEAIASIPVRAIRPFLAEPLIIDPDGLDGTPRLVASEEDRVFLGSGNIAYALGMESDFLMWNVYRNGKDYTDPDSGEFLGKEAVYVGKVKLIDFGEPAVVEIVSSKLEMGIGDRLLPIEEQESVSYVPHAPGVEIDGRVMDIFGTVDGSIGEAGPLSIVTISKGLQDGIDQGAILALYRFREVRSRNEDGTAMQLSLPEERYGLVFVFRIFERMSYALVVNAKRAVKAGDIVRNP